MAVFDEAQALKNADTRRARASRQIPAAFRVALTGTPIENRLEDLWSLFNLINPGLLGTRQSFQKRFAAISAPAPGEENAEERASEAQSAARQALRALVRPFILRRTKSEVLTELPPRTEQLIEVELPDDERAFYEALRRAALAALEAARDEKELDGSRTFSILTELTKLRRACCAPALVDPETPLSGAKLSAFMDLVSELVRGGHKALVFSQFVGCLTEARKRLDAAGYAYQYLDGSTPERERRSRVAAFQSGVGDLFLISLKAGGQGLNLTAADYVIHLDPWWNPAVEDQASDRAYRLGQKRPVTVYRLLRSTVEESIIPAARSRSAPSPPTYSAAGHPHLNKPNCWDDPGMIETPRRRRAKAYGEADSPSVQNPSLLRGNVLITIARKAPFQGIYYTLTYFKCSVYTQRNVIKCSRSRAQICEYVSKNPSGPGRTFLIHFIPPNLSQTPPSGP